MQAMAWWLVPLVAFVLAIVWVSIANRPRPPADPHDSVAEHERFIEALERPLGETGSASRLPDPDTDGPEPTGPVGPTGLPA
jgi:hypothetical protein